MIGLLCFVLAILASPFKSKLRLQAENDEHHSRKTEEQRISISKFKYDLGSLDRPRVRRGQGHCSRAFRQRSHVNLGRARFAPERNC
jgi:hypothetical protein